MAKSQGWQKQRPDSADECHGNQARPLQRRPRNQLHGPCRVVTAQSHDDAIDRCQPCSGGKGIGDNSRRAKKYQPGSPRDQRTDMNHDPSQRYQHGKVHSQCRNFHLICAPIAIAGVKPRPGSGLPSRHDLSNMGIQNCQATTGVRSAIQTRPQQYGNTELNL